MPYQTKEGANLVKGRRMVVINNTDVTVDEAAKALNIPAYLIHRWLQRGHLKDRGYRELPLARPRRLVDLEELMAFYDTRSKLVPK